MRVGARFKADWNRCFGAVAPLGWVLRYALWARWVRFHALPDSKRYPDDGVELGIVLRRGNALCSHFFGEGRLLWLVSTRDHPATERFGLKAGPRGAEDGMRWRARVGQVFWRPGEMDDLWTAIADDKARALLFDPQQGRVFAPYDGGFDLVLENAEAVASAREAFADWLSPREDGL